MNEALLELREEEFPEWKRLRPNKSRLTLPIV